MKTRRARGRVYLPLAWRLLELLAMADGARLTLKLPAINLAPFKKQQEVLAEFSIIWLAGTRCTNLIPANANICPSVHFSVGSMIGLLDKAAQLHTAYLPDSLHLPLP